MKTKTIISDSWKSTKRTEKHLFKKVVNLWVKTAETYGILAWNYFFFFSIIQKDREKTSPIKCKMIEIP